ncbi:MAG: LytTR family DNA-binding domain-containing protein [bacterium]
MTITVVIADDEPIARDGLRDMLAEVEWLRVVGEASNGLAAVEVINTLQPELVFLDIQMPGLLGTDVLGRVSHQPFVVFTTAYAQHAVTAFELGALDYILKPFGAERLAKCLERVRAAFGEPNTLSAFSRLREALSNGPMSRLFVRAGGGIVPVVVADIAWLESSGDYVTAHVGRSRYMLHLALSRLEARLDPTRFVRIHRTHIVNLDHVLAFKAAGRGRLVAELDDGATLVVSRERAKELRVLGV